MIVKVKSREMTALSKSKREDQDWRTRGKQSLGSNGAESWPRGDFHSYPASALRRIHLFHYVLSREQYALSRVGNCFRTHNGRRKKRRTRKKTRLKMSRVAYDG